MHKKEKVRLLLTSSRGVINLGRVKSLKNNPDYDFYIVGVDALGDRYKLPMIDEQFKVPFGREKPYLKSIIEIVKKKQIDVLLPASDYEVYAIAKHVDIFQKMGVSVVSSSFEKIAK